MPKPKATTPFSTEQPMQESYYRSGHYLNTITMAKLNRNGQPVFTFNVNDSFDGAHINSYYTINFFMGPKATSELSGQLWAKKFSELMYACGIKAEKGKFNVDLQSLVGKQVTLEYTKAGYSPLPNLKPAAKFDKAWRYTPKAKVPAQKLTPLTNQQKELLEQAKEVQSDPDKIDFDDDIPF